MTTTAQTKPVTHKDRILELLKRGPVDFRALNSIGFRYSARIHDLRAEGHDIRWRADKATGAHIYWLEESA